MANDMSIKAVITAEDRSGGAFKSAKNSVSDLAKGVALGQLAVDAFKSTMNQLGNVLQTGIKFEQFRVSFSTMMGSIGQGNLMLKNLYDFAATTPFEIEEVVNAGKKLMAMGISARDVLPTLRTLGDVAAGVGTEKLPQLILAYGQVQTATKLTGMELRQFTEAGVPLLENLAQITGKSTAEIKYGMEHGIAVPASLVKQALENSTKEGGKFYDLMNKQSRTLGGAISNLKDSFTLMSAKVGEVASTALAPLINKIAQFIKNNGAMIISVTMAGISVITFVGIIFGAIKAFQSLSVMATALKLSFSALSIPLILISTLLGVVVYKAMKSFQDKTQQAIDSALNGFTDLGKGAQEDLGGKAAKAAEDLAEKLQDIDDQIIKSNKNFTENLAEMIKSSQDKIKELTASIAEETADYEKENKKKLDDFTKTQNDITTEHEKKVAELKQQIYEETYTDREANQARLQDLRDKLAQENSDYDSQFAENKAKYEQDTLEAKTEHDKKMTDFQIRLDAEKTLLANHSAEVLSIKDFQYRDEIQKLIDSHAAELVEFDKQKEKAKKAAAEQGASMALSSLESQKSILSSNSNFLNQVGADLGTNMGTALKNALTQALKDLFTKDVPRILGTAWDDFKLGLSLISKKAYDPNYKGSLIDLISGRASGGQVTSNTPFIVGEKGPEIFVPSSSGNIIPNNKLSNISNSSNGLTINNYNTFNNQTDSIAFARELGWQLAK